VLWACIHLPRLALDGVLRHRHACADAGADADSPLVLVTGPAQKRVLAAVNPAAARAGLHEGQSLAAAHALLAGFATVEHDPGAVARWRDFLAAWAYRYSSRVGTTDDAIVLEIQASLRLFGPWPLFERRLRADLDALGFAHRIAVAPNPRAARVLAGMHDGLAIVHEATLQTALSRVPVARAQLDPAHARALHAMGLRRLGQLFAAPRESLGKRFGAGLLQHLDCLRGAPDPIVAYAPPDRFDLRIELAFEVESSQALLFPLRRMTADLGAYLAGRDGGVQRFIVRLEHDGHADTEVVVGLLAAERDPALLFELSRSRLEQAQVPAPVRGMRLLAEELPPFVPAGRELFDERPAQSVPWDTLRERLRARLGEDAVYGLAAQDDHRPEQAWRRVPLPPPTQLPVPAAPRPTWLLPRPVPLRGHGQQPLAGPERIESGWWDGGDVRRDYYVVRTRDGQCAWAFRPAGNLEAPLMLQGWFA
jgi:protein ImuB